VRLGGNATLMGFGHILDLSMSGAFVATALRPALLGNIQVGLTDSPAAQMQWLAAFVVRYDTHGIGIEWSQFGPAQISAVLQHAAPERLIPLSVALDQYRRTVGGRIGA
jgi:hypothetical protein